MAHTGPNIHLYTHQTPNGIKISIALEELGLPYQVTDIDIDEHTQKEPWFLEINPNGRIPAITDTFTDGKNICIFESGAILQYLIEHYDEDHKISYPKDTREYYEMNNWLFFQMGGLGPMQGQSNHFMRYASEDVPYGIKRYRNETRRLYRVLDTHLTKTGSPYLVADKCTIADIAHYGWIASAWWSGVEIEEFPKLQEWEERMVKRDGVAKGRHVPTRHTMKERKNDPKHWEEYQKKQKAWVQRGMEDDAK